GLESTSGKINEVKNKVHKWAPLKFYTSTDKGTDFSVRYHGQEVATLKCGKSSVYLHVNPKTDTYFKCPITGVFEWRSEKGKAFRNYFKNHLDKNLPNHVKEHIVENLFLTGLTSSPKASIFKHRTAITLPSNKRNHGLPLQFPVPFSASNGKIGATIGHIDILGRSKNGAHLSVWEIKYVGKSKLIVKQAYVYALQVLFMLSENSLRERWLKLFGFSKGRTRLKAIEIVLAVSKDQQSSVEEQIAGLNSEIFSPKPEGLIKVTGAYYDYDPINGITDIKYVSYK
ncbi:MAG: hypothetical protein WAX69_05485, partial [Victivallales bacterium]